MACTTKSMLSHTLPSSAKAASMRVRLADVAIDQGGGLQRFDQRHHALAEQIALIGKGQLRACFMQRLGDAPGDGMLVGHAHDQAAFALHEA